MFGVRAGVNARTYLQSGSVASGGTVPESLSRVNRCVQLHAWGAAVYSDLCIST